MSDLKERLRTPIRMGAYSVTLPKCEEAAARIEALEEALEPFADYARCYDAEHSWNGEYSAPDHCLVVGDIMWEGGHVPRVGDLRRARAVLEDKS